MDQTHYIRRRGRILRKREARPRPQDSPVLTDDELSSISPESDSSSEDFSSPSEPEPTSRSGDPLFFNSDLESTTERPDDSSSSSSSSSSRPGSNSVDDSDSDSRTSSTTTLLTATRPTLSTSSSTSTSSTISTVSSTTPVSRTKTLTPASDVSKSSASPTADSQSSGLSTGTYVGIVGGVIVLAFILIGVAICFVRKKKNQGNDSYDKPEDEKNLNRRSSRSMLGIDAQNLNGPPSPVSPVNHMPAPRLELRPQSNLSSFMALSNTGSSINEKSGQSEKRSSSIKPPPPALALQNNNQQQQQPQPQQPQTPRSQPQSSINNSGDDNNMMSDKAMPSAPFAAPQPSPALSGFSEASTVMGAPSPQPQSQPLNVYRIVMDFQPTKPDELELRTGELVRMLHEYDDGWGLCIRMDRTQQGVCPRVCLSQRPMKPRPPPGARGGPSRPNGPPHRQAGPHPPPSPSPSMVPLPHSPMTSAPPSPMGPHPQSPRNHSPAPQAHPGRQPHPLSNVQQGQEAGGHTTIPHAM